MQFPERIDVHAHLIPTFYRDACVETGNGKPDGMPAIPAWDEEKHLELMKEHSITKSILSVSSPGVHLVSADGKIRHSLARKCNEYTAELVRRRPEQFGFWASLPLPDISATLEEIPYALNTLHASGIVLETNQHGVYLGDPSLDAVFDELNRNKATVFIHPTSPCIRDGCTANSDGPSYSRVNFLPQFPSPMIEFMFDTTRALINLFTSGTIARSPDITFVIPHAGATLPPILQRVCGFASLANTEVEMNLKVIKETFKRQFYFDLAGFPFPDQIHGILRVVGPEKLLYGSDFPFTPHHVVKLMAEWMITGLEDIFPDEAMRRAILVGNARKLLGMGDK